MDRHEERLEQDRNDAIRAIGNGLREQALQDRIANLLWVYQMTNSDKALAQIETLLKL